MIPEELTPVKSSNLQGVGYDPDTQKLFVEFKTGGRYAYLGVPQEVYEDLMAAASVGAYFIKMIRSKYQFESNGF